MTAGLQYQNLDAFQICHLIWNFFNGKINKSKSEPSLHLPFCNEGGFFMLKRRIKKVMISLLVLLLVMNSIPIYPISYGNTFSQDYYNGYSPDYMNPESILDFMPRLGQDPVPLPNPRQGIQPTLPPAMQGQMTPSDAPNSRDYDPSIEEIPTPIFENPVNVITGNLDLSSVDLQLPGIGMEYIFERKYFNDLEEQTELGIGWLTNIHSQLRIYAGYHMEETRSDGSIHTHNFVMEDEDAYITEYDGDELINYELHLGYFEETESGDQLERISQHEYVVTKADGSKITYYGYYAPWRETQSEKAGKMIRYEDKYGNTFRYDYDNQGRLSTVIDTTGRTIKFNWNQQLIQSIEDPTGRKVIFQYDDQNRLIQVTKVDGSKIQYTYDSKNRVTSIIDDVKTTSFTYNNDGKITSVRMFGEEFFQMSYSSNKTIVKDRANREWTYEHNGEQITKTINPLGEVTSYEYDQDQNLIKITSPQGTIRYAYDNQGNRTEEINLAGGKTTYHYHEKWQLPTKIIDPLNGETTFEYDDKGNVTKRTDAAGVSFEFSYDNRGQLKQLKDAQGNVTKFEYNNLGLISEIIHPSGKKEVFTHDQYGRVTKEVLPNGMTVTYSYDSKDNLLTHDLGNGVKTTYTYDQKGRLKTIKDPIGRVTTFNYDDKGQIVSMTNPSGTTEYTYDRVGQIKTIKNPQNEVITYMRDALGRVTKIERPKETVDYKYGPFGVTQVEITTGNNKKEFHYEYDNRGNIIKISDEFNRTIRFSYNIVGYRTKMIDPLGRENSWTYDAVGNEKTWTDANGNVTEYIYNNVGELVEVKHPNGTSTKYKYDSQQDSLSVLYQTVQKSHLRMTLLDG